MSATTLIYTTKARAKRKAVFSAISNDIVTDFLASAERWAERFCDRLLGSASRTEVYNGDGTDTLFLKQVPVSSITSITITDANGDSEALSTSNPDYVFEPANGRVQFGPDNGSSYAVFPASFIQNVSVVYTGGESTIDDDIQEGIILKAAADYASTSLFMKGGVGKQTIGGASMERITEAEIAAMITRAENLLWPFKRLEV